LTERRSKLRHHYPQIENKVLGIKPVKTELLMTARWRQAHDRELLTLQSKLIRAASRAHGDVIALASCWLRSLDPEERAARLSKFAR
jgi:hypothetical protein